MPHSPTPSPLSDEDFDRLARFVSGEAVGSERAETGRWINEDPERRAELQVMAEAWSGAGDQAGVNVESAWVGLERRIRDGAESAPNDSKIIPLRSVRPLWRYSRALQLAAAAAFVLVGGSVLAPRFSGKKALPVGTGGYTGRYQTAAGERRTIRLADGTSVTLAPASSIVVGAQFNTAGSEIRSVELSGEALFEVVHDQSHPFRVTVGTTVIEDLGTEFAVRGYPGESGLRVAVSSGSVSVRRESSGDSASVLAPRDVAILRDTGAIALTRGVDVTPFMAFSSGRLVFADTPLAEVVRELTRWYGVEVRVTDAALLDRRLTATFDSDSLDVVLGVIGMTLSVHYDRTSSGVNFTGPSAGGPGSAGGGGPSSSAIPAPTPPRRREAGV